jgi:hypothetical protein
MPMYDVSGAHDMHVHCAPDIVDRVGDDFEVARACRRAGYKSMLIKSHIESTVSRAYHVNKDVSGLNVYGAITLNSPVGGINPTAAEIALKLGAKEIFMPTSYSAAHAKIHGRPGRWAFRKDVLHVETEPVSVLDDRKRLLPEVSTILELAKEYAVPVGTGHLSAEEIILLCEKAHQIGTQIIITHPHFHPPNLDDTTLTRLVSQGAKIELCAGTVYPVPGYGRVEQVVQSIQSVGYKNFMITSDAGTPTKPMPPDTLSAYLYCLMMRGIPKEQLDFMFKENPAQIFGIPD